MNQADNDAGRQALGNAITALLGAPVLMATALAGALARRSTSVGSGGCAAGCDCGGCKIPPPCWEPRRVGSCSLTLTPGGSGTIRVHITNCGWQPQVVSITAGGVLAGWMKFEPTTLVLGPQESARFLVHVFAPQHLNPGVSISGPLLIRGCRDYVARVHVSLAECAGRNCCDIAIDDCADHIHHWYDHFYCPRPCNPGRPAGTVSRG